MAKRKSKHRRRKSSKGRSRRTKTTAKGDKRKSNKRKRRSGKRRRKSTRRNRGKTAASRAGSALRQGSSEAGRLLGEIGEDIRHEGYHRNPGVEVEEFQMNPCGGSGTRGANVTRLKRRLMNS